jgi:hypothetical protein
MHHPDFTADQARRHQLDMLEAAERHRLVRHAHPHRAFRDRLRATISAIGDIQRHDRRRGSAAIEPTAHAMTSSHRHARPALPANRDKPAPVVDPSPTSVVPAARHTEATPKIRARSDEGRLPAEAKTALSVRRETKGACDRSPAFLNVTPAPNWDDLQASESS